MGTKENKNRYIFGLKSCNKVPTIISEDDGGDPPEITTADLGLQGICSDGAAGLLDAPNHMHKHIGTTPTTITNKNKPKKNN